MTHMMMRRYGKRLALVTAMAVACSAPAASRATAEPAPKPGKPINAGDVLSGELTAMKVRGPARASASPPIRSPANRDGCRRRAGCCNLETGPETFQLITSSDAQAAQLKNFIGKAIAIKVDEVACAQDAGQMSEAVVTKWSVVTKH